MCLPGSEIASRRSGRNGRFLTADYADKHGWGTTKNFGIEKKDSTAQAHGSASSFYIYKRRDGLWVGLRSLEGGARQAMRLPYNSEGIGRTFTELVRPARRWLLRSTAFTWARSVYLLKPNVTKVASTGPRPKLLSSPGVPLTVFPTASLERYAAFGSM
jgi:hypothetical protein